MSKPRIIYDDRPWIVRLLSQGWLHIVMGAIIGVVFLGSYVHDGLATAGFFLTIIAAVMMLPQLNRRLPYAVRRLTSFFVALGLVMFFVCIAPGDTDADSSSPDPYPPPGKAVIGVPGTPSK